MPEMDGLEASRTIGSEHGERRPQIIAMTANVLQGDRDRCAAAGMDDYVAKPIRIRELQSAIAAAARRVYERRGAALPSAVAPVPRTAPASNDPDLDRQAIFDPSAFDEAREFLAEEADEVIGRLLASFDAKTPEMVSALRRAAEQRDHQQVRFVAHTLKGLSGTVGARRVQAICGQIESSAGNEETEYADSTLSRLEKELDSARKALSTVIGSAAAG